MLDQRGQLLRAAVGFAGLPRPSYDRALWALRTWLNSWSGIGHVAVGMARQGYDLQLTRYDERGWRGTFYTIGMEHSPTSATGTGWEPTPWHATRAGGVGDFLWSESSDFFLTPLPQLLSSHRRQMMLLVVRDLTVPHHEDDLQPLGAQGPQSRTMIVAPRPLLLVVCPGPLTLPQREKRHLIDDVAQRLVTGEAEPNDPLLAAPDRHGHGARMPL